MPQTRDRNERNHELQMLDAAHLHNEVSRDTFVALAHTALFAASVSFIGDVAPLESAVWKPLVIFAWFASVVGLLAHTFAFVVVRKQIDARRDAIDATNPPNDNDGENLNAIALWTFPLALLSIFAFVAVNVVNVDVKPAKAAVLDQEGHGTASSRAESKTLDRRGAGSSSPGATATGSQAAKEVTGR